jgi:hypothetical protein
MAVAVSAVGVAAEQTKATEAAAGVATAVRGQEVGEDEEGPEDLPRGVGINSTRDLQSSVQREV